jgi:hypothetical protein
MNESKLTPAEKLEIKAKIFVSTIDLTVEYPKLSRKMSKYIYDMQVRAYIAGYQKSTSDFFEDMVAKFELANKNQNHEN